MGKLKSSTVKMCDLTSIEVNEMYQLFAKYYENTSMVKFQSDLEKKDKVILLKDKKYKMIRGFSTIQFIKTTYNKKTVYGLFSGDTIIDKDFWGQTALTMEFFKNLVSFKIKHLFDDFYWFLISKGFKTYLLLTNNFETYYPRFDKEIPSEEQNILADFSEQLFPGLYDAEKGILKCADAYDRLKGETAPIENRFLSNPNIKFFADSNPNWQAGDELCCLGKVDLGLARRYLTRTYKKRLMR